MSSCLRKLLKKFVVSHYLCNFDEKKTFRESVKIENTTKSKRKSHEAMCRYINIEVDSCSFLSLFHSIKYEKNVHEMCCCASFAITIHQKLESFQSHSLGDIIGKSQTLLLNRDRPRSIEGNCLALSKVSRRKNLLQISLYTGCL